MAPRTVVAPGNPLPPLLQSLHSLSHCKGGIRPKLATALRADIHPLATAAFWPWANMERRTFCANACMSPGGTAPPN